MARGGGGFVDGGRGAAAAAPGRRRAGRTHAQRTRRATMRIFSGHTSLRMHMRRGALQNSLRACVVGAAFPAEVRAKARNRADERNESTSRRATLSILKLRYLRAPCKILMRTAENWRRKVAATFSQTN